MSRRITLAFAVAPLLAAVLYAIAGLIRSAYSMPGEFWVTIVVAYVYAFIGTVVIALPAFLVAGRLKIVRWWSALIAGAVLGLLFSSLIGVSGDGAWLWRVELTGIGATSGIMFWLIAAVHNS